MVIRKCVPNALGRATVKMGYSILTRELVNWINYPLYSLLNVLQLKCKTMNAGDEIMALKCTVTTDLQAKDTNGYSGIQKHVEHDQSINHSNKDIVFSETQFNVYDESTATRQAIDDWNEQHFHNYVEQHDQHQREKGHAERQYGSVKNFLKRKKKATAVLTIGNMEVQSQLMKEFCPASSYVEEKLPDGTTHLVFKLKDEHEQPIKNNIAVAKRFYDCFNRALITATNNNVGWNLKSGKRVNIGDYLHRGRYATNNDEMGISHIHYEIATFGMTRGGKKRPAHATNSLNQALVSLHHAVTGQYCSGRAATKWYRASIDKFALKCLETELHKTYKVPQNKKILEFERKTETDKSLQTGLSMEQLKAQHQEIAEHKEAIQSLQKQTNDLTNQNNNVKHQVETVTKNLKAIYEATTGHQAVDKDGNDLTPLEMANGITHAARASQSNKEQADKDMVATQEKEKAAKQQQEQLLNQQRQQLQTLQNQINDADEQLKQRKLQRVKEAQQEFDRNNLMYGDNEPITADNINDVEASIDQWRNDQRQQWQTDQTKHTKLINDNKDLQTQNDQLTTSNQAIQDNINSYKNQLVDSIAQNDPSHQVEQSLLNNNERPQPVNTDPGRQQHLKQNIKYLIKVAAKALQKVKEEALKFVDQITKTLTTPTNPNQPKPNLKSRYLDPSTIQASKHPFDYQREKQLMNKLNNDPILKLQKAILFANQKQSQKATQQITNAMNKRLNKDDERQF